MLAKLRIWSKHVARCKDKDQFGREDPVRAMVLTPLFKLYLVAGIR